MTDKIRYVIESNLNFPPTNHHISSLKNGSFDRVLFKVIDATDEEMRACIKGLENKTETRAGPIPLIYLENETCKWYFREGIQHYSSKKEPYYDTSCSN